MMRSITLLSRIRINSLAPRTFASTTTMHLRSLTTSSHSQLRERLRDEGLFREKAYVDGHWAQAASGKEFTVTNPYDGSEIGQCPEMDRADLHQAIQTAQTAFEQFRYTPARQRVMILRKWCALMAEHEEDLATILAYENGRPLEAAKAEIQYAASFLDWFQAEAVRSYGDVIESSVAGTRVLTMKQPIGVVGIITPWNFPSAMITRKVGASVAAGCSVVLKPAAETPYSALALAELGERAGLPAGVFNVVTTDANVSDMGLAMCEHDLVKKVSFTGSTTVGKILMKESSSTLKKLSLELGGNAPFIVFDDADFDKALQGLMDAKFRGSGQTCVCANRVYVQSGIYEKFLDRFTAIVNEKIKFGDPLAPGTTLGPLINIKAVQKIERLVSDAIEKGAKVVSGDPEHRSEAGTTYPALILRDMNQDMQASKEELFGPVVACYRFENDEDLLKMANDSEVGLAGYVYTSKLDRAWRIAEALQTGMVGVNTGMVSDPVAPFGGIKHSGFGREGGRTGIEEFQVLKTITLGGVAVPM